MATIRPTPAMPAARPSPESHVPRHIRTRRKLWLSTHPSYFEQAGHALSLPLAYDRLIRVYQSPAEREAQNRSQGWAKMLEGALVRGEAKRDQAVKTRKEEASAAAAVRDNGKITQKAGEQGVEQQDAQLQGSTAPETGQQAPKLPVRGGLKPLPEEVQAEGLAGDSTTSRSPAAWFDDNRDQSVGDTTSASKWDVPLGIVPADELFEASPEFAAGADRLADGGAADAVVDRQAVVDGLGKEQALGRWHELLRARFVAGGDEDFEYDSVDDQAAPEEEWLEARRQDDWFDGESEAWSDDGNERGKKLKGETGVQDF